MDLKVSNCCDAPVNVIMKGDVTSFTCAKCGNECKVKKASKPFVHKKGRK